MTPARPTGHLGTAVALWKRAPLWRFCVLSTALSLLLVLLVPPHPTRDGVPTDPALGQASYRAPSRRAPLPATPPSPSPPDATPGPAGRQVAPGAAATAVLALATPNGAAGKRSDSGLDAALIGRTYRGELLMNGFRVPLPPGEWALLASFKIWVKLAPDNTGMSYFLARFENQRLAGAMIVNALRSPAAAPTGFAAFAHCDNPDDIFTSKEALVAFDHQACWVIHTIYTPPWQQWGDKAVKMENIVRAAAGDMAAKGVTYPQDLIAVHFFRSEKWGVLNGTYLFSPEHEGIASTVAPSFRDSDWFPPHYAHDPEKLAYIERLRQWGESFWPRFKAAFDAGH